MQLYNMCFDTAHSCTTPLDKHLSQTFQLATIYFWPFILIFTPSPIVDYIN